MTDGVTEVGAVERVEVELPHAARIKPAAEFRRHRGRDELARRGTVVEPVEQAAEPTGHCRPAHRRHALRLREIRHRQDSGHELRVETRGGRSVPETEEGFRLEAELRDGAARPRVELALQIVDIACRGGRLGVYP